MKSKKLLQNISWTCVLLSSCAMYTLQAAETPTPHSSDIIAKETHAQCTRPLSKKQKRAIQKERSIAAKKTEKAFTKGTQGASKMVSKDMFAPSGFSSGSYHIVKDASTKGLTVEIQDGSIFAINEDYKDYVKAWPKDSELRITPNRAWFSSYDYVLRNIHTGTCAEAKLSQGPVLTRPQTRRVYKMDKDTSSRKVMLDNGACYQVSGSSSNRKLFAEWELSDNIIVGDNDSWFTFGNDYILINVATDSYVTASRLK